MNPIDYSGAFNDGPSPQASLMQGYKDGVGMQAMQQEQQQKQAALARQQQMNADLQALSQNPTSQAIGQMSIKYPQLSEQFKRSYDMLEPAQKQAKLDHATQVYAALNADQPEIAQKLLKEQATALRNSGDERGAGATDAMAEIIKINPGFAKTSAGLLVSSIAGPEKFASTFAALGGEQRAAEQAPGQLMKTNADGEAAVADAATKKVGAKYAEQGALLELEKKGWDITKIKADIQIAKESNRIAAMNAAASREGNTLKREELQLKIDDARTARDDKVREKVSKAESAVTSMDNMLNTIQRVLKSPGLNDVLGSLEGSSAYPNQAMAMVTGLSPVNSSGDDRADAIALIDTLGSQAFLSQVPTVQGMGSLSNAEGEKLQSALQNLSRKQSETQFRASLNEAARLVTKGRENVSKKFGAPASTPDTPAVRTTRPPLSSFSR